ncbi:serpentine type 7TM GPCR chemoreceptor srh domain-containing protein [Ditylenchus destructor]|uniref:Serpentine type 7TM GPCR chemoreceptor srh domain-containing protein n=1 Tax=Ditylenchus destructor TaxID=166010 RepID=A0AAD4R1A0_9BILA|nr:serpentine type 7TM GPCR chemoreceptor srh domain-containing protein [Ditylenchus destructor]
MTVNELISTFESASSYFVLILSPLCFLLFFWAVYTKSPRAMGSYKWYMIANAVFLEIFLILYAIGPMEPLVNLIFVPGGLMKNAEQPEIVTRVFASTCITATIFALYFNALLFVCRYCQTSGNRLFKLLSDFKKTVFVSFCLLLVPVAGIATVVNVYWASKTELLDEIKAWSPSVYENVRNRTIFGCKKSSKNTFIVLLAVIGLPLIAPAVFAVPWSTLGCYRVLRANKRSLTERTLALYRRLINALVIEIGIIVCIVCVPGCSILVAYVLQFVYSDTSSNFESSIFMLMTTVCTYYPMITNMVTIIYIKPYRKAIFGLYWRLSPFGRRQKEAVRGPLSETTATKKVQFFTRNQTKILRHNQKSYSVS